METARKLRADKFRGFLVFIMVLKEMVFQSFEVQAYDYLDKPAQIENELSKKDNDTYRRQNASFDNSD